MRRRTTLLLSVATFSTAALLWACADGGGGRSIVAPRLTPSADRTASTLNGGDVDHLVSCTKRQPKHATALIGADGGRLDIGPNVLLVPPGALDHPTLISGTVVPDTLAIVTFEPEGLQFEIPAILKLNSAGCRIPLGATPEIVYVEDTTIVEDLPSFFERYAQKVVAPIKHFSGYAIAF